MTQEVLKLALEALERSVATCFDQYAHRQVMSQPDHFINQAITAIKEALREHAMREVQRLGQEIEQEPVAHLWECLGRWSAYLVNNGTQAECAPPSWLVDAIKKATTPPQRTWVGLTDDEIIDVLHPLVMADMSDEATDYEIARAIEAKLKERNA